MAPYDFDAFFRDLSDGGWSAGANVVAALRVDSTNRLARRALGELAPEGQLVRPVVIAAWEQTGGRGRRGTVWRSPPGEGVYLSLLVPVPDPEALMLLPLLVGIVLCASLAPLLAEGCGLKWPNDLMVRGRKLGGLLIEAVACGRRAGHALVSFGVNVEGRTPLPRGATSLRGEGAAVPALGQLAWQLASAVLQGVAAAPPAGDIVDRYRALSVHRPGEALRCRLHDRVVEGSFRGFTPTGLLQLEVAGRQEVLPAAEILSEAGEEG